MPLFLQSLLGCAAESAGLVLSRGGVLLLFMMPVIGFLSSKVQARYLIAVGWLALSLAMFYSSRRLDLDISFRVPRYCESFRGSGWDSCFYRSTWRHTSGYCPNKAAVSPTWSTSCAISGSSVGTSTVMTLVARRAQVHQAYLVANVTRGHPSFAETAAGLTNRVFASGFGPNIAVNKTYALIYRNVIGQATTLAYLDTFLVLWGIAAVMFVLSFTLKKNEFGGPRPMAD